MLERKTRFLNVNYSSLYIFDIHKFVGCKTRGFMVIQYSQSKLKATSGYIQEGIHYSKLKATLGYSKGVQDLSLPK